MKDIKIFNTAIRLVLICIAAALSLSLINGVTGPVIKERDRNNEKAALKQLYPGGAVQEKKAVNTEGVVSRWDILGRTGLEAVILELKAEGYGGSMKVMASFKLDGEVINAKLLNNEETPGLGKNAENPGYMDKFTGKGGFGSYYDIPLSKSDYNSQKPKTDANSSKKKSLLSDLFFGSPSMDADSITGATITFTGIAESLKTGSDYIKRKAGDTK